MTLCACAGVLGAPTHLNAYSVNNSIHLSWSAPSTLNLTNIEPDIQHYVVSVHNTHTGHNSSESVIVSTTEYLRSPNTSELGRDICKEIEFRVRAVNVVGEGNQSEVIRAAYHKGKGSRGARKTLLTIIIHTSSILSLKRERARTLISMQYRALCRHV